MTKFSTSGFVHPVTGCDVRGKDVKEQSVRERVRERERNDGNASGFRERRREGGREIISTSSFQKFKRETRRDSLPKTNASSSQQTRAAVKREKERTRNI